MIFRDYYWFLSNMYPCQIIYKGHTYSCVEAAFQAQKDVSRSSEFEHIDGFAAKKLGRKVNMRKDWNNVRLEIMKEILKVKFSNKKLMEQLQKITGQIVEENTWKDTYWGVCNGYGQNNLGKLLMQIRDEGT